MTSARAASPPPGRLPHPHTPPPGRLRRLTSVCTPFPSLPCRRPRGSHAKYFDEQMLAEIARQEASEEEY